MKPFCQELGRANSQFKIPENSWEHVAQFHEPLKLVARKMTALQRADITLSDAYGDWVELQQSLKCVQQTPFVKNMLAALTGRGAFVLKSPMMVASVFLDPRFNILLETSDREIANTVLAELSKNSEMETTNSSTTVQNNEDVDETQLTPFERHLRSMETTTQRNIPRTDLRLLTEIESFQQLSRQPRSKCIHEFWCENQRRFPLLYQLADTVMAIPPTEVGCERNFSKLSFLMNRLRCSLSDEEIEKMLFLSLNSDLFDFI